MRVSHDWRRFWRGVEGAVVTAALVLGAYNTSSAQSVLASGQIVAGGGRSATAEQTIVGAVVLGPSGTSSDGTNRIDGSVVYYAQAVTATYSANPVEVVNAENRTLKVAVQGGSGPVTGRLFHRLGGETSYTEESMALGPGDTLTYLLPAARLTLRGLEYYIEVVRQSTMIQIASPTEPFVFVTRLNNAAGPVLPKEQYRMIGFPFRVVPSSPLQVFEDDLGAYDPKVWRLGRYDSQSETYDEYPDIGNIARGQGYWLIVRDGGRVGASGESARPDTTIDEVDPSVRYGRIVLGPGWNQISDPFGFPVAWANRRAEAGIDAVLWAYTSGFDAVSSYVAAQALKPFEGYWLHNSAAAPRQLLLPYVESVLGVSEPKIVHHDSPEWQVNLAVTAGSVGDLVNVVGVAVGAESGRDDADFSEPPVIGDYVSLAFVGEEENGRRALLAGDFRPPVQRVYGYDVLIKGNVDTEVQLQVTIDGELPVGSRIVLLDPATQRQFDLLVQSTVLLPHRLTEGGTRYKLFVGDGEDPEFPDATALVLPRSFALAQNYPNPFNSSTEIGFDVASSAVVKITVYDVLGRVVRVLTDHEYLPGRYSVSWDGHDGQNGRAASGIYFCQFAAGDRVFTRKMALLK